MALEGILSFTFLHISEPCLAGYYSANGYGPNCQPCPVGYYSESNTSTVSINKDIKYIIGLFS